MNKIMYQHKIKKGYDIKLAGAANLQVQDADMPKRFALQPPDFPGVKLKLEVEEGDSVSIGSVLFSDKQNPQVQFLSPAGGKISLINRGERRAIMEVVVDIIADEAAISFPKIPVTEIAAKSREEVVTYLLTGGVWPYLRQRPFSKIADPQVVPRDIFISAVDTSPLAPDYSVLLGDEQEAFETGVALLKKLTSGKVYLSVDDKLSRLEGIEDVEVHAFSGPHPAGNISVQIDRIAPMKHGDIVWYIYASDVIVLGKLAVEGKFPVDRIVAVAGSSVKEEKRRYYRTRLGAPVQALVKEGDLVDDEVRFISGGVLQGRDIGAAGYIGFYDHLITVIPESHERKLFGWIYPGLKNESFSKTFLSGVLGPKNYIQDTRMHGGVRAFIQTGEYEKVMPLDILPMQLVKSIMAEDIEEMEGLGILECAPEDFALCTYICPSKIDFGAYVQKGLDMIEREG
jgi:Na+-transporting NADH:ubiquinone oxidoreductase subunit A